MSGSTAWQHWNVPTRFTAMTSSRSSLVMSRNFLNGAMPALFTRIVAPPAPSRTASTAASIAPRSVTSTSKPRPSISFAAARAESPSRSKTATVAPSSASRAAMASPMPRPPPVTIAVRGSDQAGGLMLSDRTGLVDQTEWAPRGAAPRRRRPASCCST
jgi:hypothetical protein